MGLKARVTVALKEAMRAKEPLRLSTLRLINAAVKDREIAARADAPEGAATDLPEAEMTQILAKMVKQRHESARAYEEAGRLELADQERAEIAVIEEFLPKPLSEAETEAAIAEAIAQTGATGIRDMGRVMGVLKEKYTGRLDFGAVGPRVKTQLS